MSKMASNSKRSYRRLIEPNRCPACLANGAPVEYRRWWSDVQKVKEQAAQIRLAKSTELATNVAFPSALPGFPPWLREAALLSQFWENHFNQCSCWVLEVFALGAFKETCDSYLSLLWWCNLGVWVRELPCCVDHDWSPQCASEGWAGLMWD